MLSTERRRRAVRKLAVSAAALAVCVLPTACDYSLASPPGAPAGGSSGGSPTTAPVVVPVGNTSQTSASATSERRFRDRDRDRDGDRNRPPRNRPTRPGTGTPTVVPSNPTEPTSSETVAPTSSNNPGLDPARGIVPPGGRDGNNNETTLTAADPDDKVLGRDCNSSQLTLHDGFQSDGATCVATAMGEVAASDKLPSLLITKVTPEAPKPGEAITLTVSTRNLVRDRFLGAAAGGYYLEASFLNDEGIQRGHFHTACRMISSDVTKPPGEAPAAARNELFVATQDNGGGAGADSVDVAVVPEKKTTAGIMQCASWAGDGSHRTPMMSFANQIPAFDTVRINIGGEVAAAAVPAETPATEAPAAGTATEAPGDRRAGRRRDRGEHRRDDSADLRGTRLGR